MAYYFLRAVGAGRVAARRGAIRASNRGSAIARRAGSRYRRSRVGRNRYGAYVGRAVGRAGSDARMSFRRGSMAGRSRVRGARLRTAYRVGMASHDIRAYRRYRNRRRNRSGM